MNGDDRYTAEVVASANDSTAVYEADESESVSEAVTSALSAASDTPETDLRPLYSAVDPDALDALFAPRGNGTPRRADGHVAFDYGPFRVRVESDGLVAVGRRSESE